MHGAKFSVRKTLQALYYLQRKSNVSDKLALLKLVFFADRYHIRNYGISMLQDNYCAMNLGPVCSKTYDLIKKGLYYDGLTEDAKKLVDASLFCNRDVVDVKDTGDDLLSVSDKEALDFSVENFGSFSAYQLSEITHAYPEWSRFHEILDSHISSSEEMDYADFFGDPEKGNCYIEKYLAGKDPFADDVSVMNAMREEYKQGI
ncbi:MAG: SocA family protein [Treponema sp.]|nr:SocA family protein [Treponema sp.]